MLRSMTGFGSSSIEIEGMQYSVEIRSVNNKYFKAQVRLPDELLALETELESDLARRIARGSVSVTIRRDGALSPESLSVDARMVEGVLSSLEAAVPESLADRCTIDLANLLQVPGVLVQEPVTALVDRVRPVLLKLLGQAVDAMIQMREREGLVLREDLLGFREGILARLSVVADRAPAVVEQYQQRLRGVVAACLRQSLGSGRVDGVAL